LGWTVSLATNRFRFVCRFPYKKTPTRHSLHRKLPTQTDAGEGPKTDCEADILSEPVPSILRGAEGSLQLFPNLSVTYLHTTKSFSIHNIYCRILAIKRPNNTKTTPQASTNEILNTRYASRNTRRKCFVFLIDFLPPKKPSAVSGAKSIKCAGGQKQK